MEGRTHEDPLREVAALQYLSGKGHPNVLTCTEVRKLIKCTVCFYTLFSTSSTAALTTFTGMCKEWRRALLSCCCGLWRGKERKSTDSSDKYSMCNTNTYKLPSSAATAWNHAFTIRHQTLTSMIPYKLPVAVLATILTLW